MSPRKSVERELTREMIMNAARDLFTTKGYEHVSMRQIANILGCSHGAIYYHFKNKAELFFALVEDHFKMLNSILDDIMKQELDNREKLRQIFVGYIRFGLTYQSHYEIMFLIKDDEVKNFINQEPNHTYDNFAKSVYSLCEWKKVTLQDVWSIFLSLHGFVTHYCRHVVGFDDVKDMAYRHADFLLKAIE
ncbi:TetR/AcrR family transcriptional regulator [Robertmurraya andreesenii]|uniref:AcrR family transcriptional regulator n=1 Tax=Anoxybacillus andreesenii TaxID=1325932 RepID=A0ABT9V5M5_9BACL|nr:TetR/AcrR family transcriptional regulator [Robertmurraya andreesenii]MDQ0156250.1 AcrR family transcriptional regulator [Robertmurraya andreesenii]